MINSRNKGKVAELELVHMLKDAGFEARRSQQFSGKSPDRDSPDVYSVLPIYWESKAVQNLSVFKTMDKLKEECPDGQGKWRCIAWKKNRKGWVVVTPWEDFMDIMKELAELKNMI